MVTIAGVAHVGIRVVESARSEAFYALLGFRPEQLGSGISLFIRDPDRNVVELRQEQELRTP